ncbi:MAG TPA: CHAP domain-containing protein [Solirubrobacterales bacterium]
MLLNAPLPMNLRLQSGTDTLTVGRRGALAALLAAALLATLLLFASNAYATGGLSVKLVSVSKAVRGGSQASAWFKVTPGSTCRLEARKHPGEPSTGRSVYVTRPLLQYDWTVSPGSHSGVWRVTLACVRSKLRRTASATIRVRHGGAAGHPTGLFAKSLQPTQANVTTSGDGRGSGRSWSPFGTVLVRGRDWLGGLGVDVKSNGLIGCYAGCNIATGYGIAYQCVELVQRLIVTRHWSPRIYGNANMQYANASTQYFDKHPNGSGYTPVPGDIIVYRGGYLGYGHVAVVEWVDNGRLGWVDQNDSPSGRGSAPLGAGGTLGNLGSLIPIGFLHAKANKPAPVSAPDPSSPGPKSEPKPEPAPSSGGSTADKSAPTTPTSPTASAPTTSTITLSWGKATDNVGVAGYSLYRNGTRITNSGSTSYKFSGLSCGTSYKLGVDAYDAAGNRSAAASVTASTAACPKTVSVSKGAHVNVSGCSSSACAYLTVSLANFGSGSHTVTCYADYPPPTGAFYQYTTSSTTSNVCVYGYANTHAWVKVDGIESNHLTW